MKGITALPDTSRARSVVVEREHASFTNPETRAYGAEGLPLQTLYLVGFAQSDLWADYRGRADDTLRVDLFEHWLEDAE